MHGKSKCELSLELYTRLEYSSWSYWATLDSKSLSLALNTCKLAINARRLYCDFVELSQGSLLPRRFHSKLGQKSKLLSRNESVSKMVLGKI